MPQPVSGLILSKLERLRLNVNPVNAYYIREFYQAGLSLLSVYIKPTGLVYSIVLFISSLY